MKRLYLLTLICICFVSETFAAHIVGGELEMIHLNGFRYRISLIQYFDELNPTNPGPDTQPLRVFIFRKSDDEFVRDIFLPFNSSTPVEYTNPDCAIAELSTSRDVYTTVVDLDPAAFSDPEGYYMVWERCCRNAGIVNIINPDGTGMTYTLDFPPIVVDGEPNVNSSPTLLPPLSDYGCVGQLYYTDFRGTDIDGDSLVYSLELPLSSSSTSPLPTPQPRSSHFPVTLSNGLTLNTIIPGSPSLAISNEGFLTVNPENSGLHVFSVLVKEFRDGVQIGAVQRDFQMLVLDGCLPPDPPNAVIQLPGDDTLYEEEAFVAYTVSEEKCFDFLVGNIGPDENVTVRVRPVNFRGNVNGFTFDQTRIGPDSLMYKICVPECPLRRDEPYIIDLIAADDACPLPQTDTVTLTVEVEPPPNALPVFREFPESRFAITTDEDSFFSRTIIGDDADLDDMVVSILGIGFDPAMTGISLVTEESEAGTITARLDWDTDCLVYDFSETNKFELAVILDDLDFCSDPGDTLWLDMTVNLPFNSDPEVTADFASPSIILPPDEVLNFNSVATDLDGDEMNFRLLGDGFDPEDLGVVFEDKTGFGTLSSDFTWEPDCTNIDFSDGTTFTFYLIADDFDKCQVKNFDTLAFNVSIDPGFNNKPEFTTVNEQDLRVNETIRIDVSAADLDAEDLLTVDLLPGFLTPPGQEFVFSPGQGFGSAVGVIEWTPPCELLGETFDSRDFRVFLLASDNDCPIPKYDTIQVDFTVSNLPVAFDVFEPPNVFTPNNDGRNDVFVLSGNEDVRYNLPVDNCQEQFQYMTVVDRSGREVFHTEDRDFVWDGIGNSAGVYFYFIKYTTREFRGSVTLIN